MKHSFFRPGVLRAALSACLALLFFVSAARDASAQNAFSLTDLPFAPPAQLELEITAGQSKQTVARPPMNARQTLNGLVIQTRWQRNGAHSVWTASVKNVSAAQQLLTLRWTARVRVSAGRAYWPGRGLPKASEEELSALGPTNANFNTFPLQAVYDNTRGLALALDPMQMFSDWSYTWETIDATSGAMTLKMPMVLDAGESDEIALEVYDFSPRHGHLDAVQEYFNAHPEAFMPRSDIDPRATGGGATYVVWNQNEPELARRFNGDWEWVYAAFKRTGDIYGRPEFWDYQPARPILDKTRQLPPAEFHKSRRLQLERGLRADSAMMFYVPSFIYSEEQLALQKYPDAIVRKTNGDYAVHFTSPWVTGHDNEVLMYPWANDFATQSQRDAKQLVDDNLNIQGFAYDVLNGGLRHRGAGVAGSPRRGWDENGVYVDMSVGIAKMMDFTRSLERDGRKMALVSNPTGNSRAFLAARSDAGMFERPPYNAIEELQSLRLVMGHKPLCWWDDWGLSGMLRWETMSGEEIRQAYLGARDYVLLASFAYGGAPTPRMAMGVPKLVRWLKPLRRVLRAGWQPVTGVRTTANAITGVRATPSTLWPARYGAGLGAFVTIGNRAQENYRGAIEIENAVLGGDRYGDNYLFTTLDGRALRQHISGRSTIVEVEIPAHEPLVLQAVVAIAPNASGQATVSWSDDGARGALKIDGALTPRRVLSPQPGSGAMQRDGRQWTWNSTIFGAPTENLRAFPFFDDKGPAATIVLGQNAAPDEEWAAMRLQEYFSFWGRKALATPRKIEIPIVRGTAPTTGNVIVIGGASKSAAPVNLTGTHLTIAGQSPAQTRAATLALLDALDEKYFYAGKFATAGEAAKGEPEALRKAGIAGGVLD